MRLFRYCCPWCQFSTERDLSGWDVIPTQVEEEHKCPMGQTALKRVWMSTRLNFGFRELIHSENDEWMFRNG